MFQQGGGGRRTWDYVPSLWLFLKPSQICCSFAIKVCIIFGSVLVKDFCPPLSKTVQKSNRLMKTNMNWFPINKSFRSILSFAKFWTEGVGGDPKSFSMKIPHFSEVRGEYFSKIPDISIGEICCFLSFYNIPIIVYY